MGLPFYLPVSSRVDGAVFKKIKKNKLDGKKRSDITSGLEITIVLKKNQRSGRLTEGIVKDILTKSSFHPHGIKVRLESGEVGRVKDIFSRGNI